MSLKATNYVLGRSFGNQTRKLLMIVLADYANDADESYPSIDRLATRAECSRRSVQEHLAILEKAGEIRIFQNAGPKGTNLYRIVFRKTVVAEMPAEGVQDLHGGVQMGDAHLHGGGADGRRSFAPEPLGTSIEPLGTEHPLPPPGGVGGHAVALLDEELIRNFKDLRETWNGPPVLGSNEGRAFKRNRHILVYWTADDWRVIKEFLAAPNVKGRAYIQWDIMHKALDNSAGLQAQALAWKRNQRPRFEVVPKPADGPAATAADVAEMMEALKPRRVNS